MDSITCLSNADAKDPLQHPFTGHDLPLHALDPLQRHLQRLRQRLERALGTVVVVLAVERRDVQREAGVLRKRLEPVRQHLRTQRADALALDAEVDVRKRPVRQVDDGARERLVERRVGVAEASKTSGAAERLLEGVAERDEGVLGRVVVVD